MVWAREFSQEEDNSTITNRHHCNPNPQLFFPRRRTTTLASRTQTMPKQCPPDPSNWSKTKQIGSWAPLCPLNRPFNRCSVVSFSLLLAIAVADRTLPSAQPFTKYLYTLPYRQPNGTYAQGIMDVVFVLDWLILLTALRAVFIASVYEFFTHHQLKSERSRERFAEQSWLVLYDGIAFPVGLVKPLSYRSLRPKALTADRVSSCRRLTGSTSRNFGPTGHRKGWTEG